MHSSTRPTTRSARGGRLLVALGLGLCLACSGGDEGAADADADRPVTYAWRVETSEPLGEKLGAVVFGDFDPEVPGDELAAVGESGRVWLLVPAADGWRVTEIAQAPGEMIQIAAADLDPNVEGDELVLVGMAEGGEESGGAGAVNALVRAGDAWALAPLATAGSLVHGVAVADLGPELGLEIITAGFDREVVMLARDGDGVYQPQVVAQLPGAGKNVAVHAEGAVIACTDGSLVHVERTESGAWTSRVLHEHPAGLARLSSDGERVLAAADDGALVLVDADATTTLHAESRKLRGAVLANLDPVSRGLEAACVGYSGDLSVLRRGEGGGWTAETIYRDGERLHHLAVGTPLARTSGLALATAGYGGRVSMAWLEAVPVER